MFDEGQAYYLTWMPIEDEGTRDDAFGRPPGIVRFAGEFEYFGVEKDFVRILYDWNIASHRSLRITNHSPKAVHSRFIEQVKAK